MKILKTTPFRSVGRDLRDTDDMVRAEIDFTVLEYKNFQKKVFGEETHDGLKESRRLDTIEDLYELEENLRNMSKKVARINSLLKDLK